MFSTRIKVKLHQTDAAGVLFMGSYFSIIHDAYEDFMDSIGLRISSIIEEATYVIPIVHAEGDFSRPVRAGDQLDVEVSLHSVGKSSFTLGYIMKDKSGKPVASLKTVHVAVDKGTRKKIDLPSEVRKMLKQ